MAAGSQPPSVPVQVTDTAVTDRALAESGVAGAVEQRGRYPARTIPSPIRPGTREGREGNRHIHGRVETDSIDTVSRYEIAPDCSPEEFLAVSRVYARDVVAEHDLSVDVTALEWDVSKRAKRRAGAVMHSDGTPDSIVLTWEYFEEMGWEKTAATIRHELIHVHLLNEAGDPGHGPAFEQLADQLDTHVHCERFATPKYWVRCDDCSNRLARYKKSKLVKQPQRYRCGDCGGPLEVERTE